MNWLDLVVSTIEPVSEASGEQDSLQEVVENIEPFAVVRTDVQTKWVLTIS